MKIKKSYIWGLVAGLFVVSMAFIFYGTPAFYLIFGIGVIIAAAPFVFQVLRENEINLEKEEMFLEFARDLVEGVKTGTPISKSLINISDKNYGVLSPYIRKLANQIFIGIPLNTAFQNFSKDLNNKVISRAITLIGQAERAGGDIGEILESVAEAVNTSDKLKKERKATISTLVVQGYIIFFVFIIIMLVMQFKILPMVEGISSIDIGVSGGALPVGVGSSSDTTAGISNSFLYLLLVQGFFTGLVIGKISENSAKAGIKHSFSLMIMSFLISSVANVIFG